MYALFLTKEKLHLVHFHDIHELYKVCFNYTLLYTKLISTELHKGNRELDHQIRQLARFSANSEKFGEYLLEIGDSWNEQQYFDHLEELRSAMISVRAMIFGVLSLSSTTESFA